MPRLLARIAQASTQTGWTKPLSANLLLAMGIVKQKGDGDCSKDLGMNAGLGRHKVRANAFYACAARLGGADKALQQHIRV